MRLSKSRRERTWTPAFFIFSFFMREKERERERLVRLFGRVRRQRGFSSSRVIQKPSPPREQDGERKKEKSGNARKRPRETTLLANALVPASRRIRSKRTFERRSFSSNVPFFFSFSLFRASLSLSCARKCTRTQRKNPPSSGFLSLPRERKF